MEEVEELEGNWESQRERKRVQWAREMEDGDGEEKGRNDYGKGSGRSVDEMVRKECGWLVGKGRVSGIRGQGSRVTDRWKWGGQGRRRRNWWEV